MNKALIAAALAASLGFVPGIQAHVLLDIASVSGGGSVHLPAYLQCVPYARTVTGISIFGDAHTWWGQAAGRYGRGYVPKVGAVMAFKPHGKMVLGHVAAVSKIVDSRTILLRHANWSLINGRRGQIEDNVRAVDVSENNDWSAVRVWFAPIQALGGTAWPVQGFIYNKKPHRGEAKLSRITQNSDNYVVSSDPIGDIIAAKMRVTPQRHHHHHP